MSLGTLSDADLNRLGQIVLRQLGAGDASRTKAVSSTPTTTYGHGPGGLFSNSALERPIFSAMVLPRTGLQNMLPARDALRQPALRPVHRRHRDDRQRAHRRMRRPADRRPLQTVRA